jgi:hypothetical protein
LGFILVGSCTTVNAKQTTFYWRSHTDHYGTCIT